MLSNFLHISCKMCHADECIVNAALFNSFKRNLHNTYIDYEKNLR